MNVNMARVKKGVILCAGKGTSLRPLTLNRPKPAVMLANKPMLCYCIQKLVDVNIRDIGIIIGPEGDKIKAIVKSTFPDLNPVFITQQKPTGVAAAVSEAENFVSGESFVLLLGDNFFAENLTALTDLYEPNSMDAVIMVTYVQNPGEFGVVVFDEEKVEKVVEKPKDLVSNWAITGAYIFGPAIFSAIKKITPSWRGELEITDAIQWLLNNGNIVESVKTNKWWLDTGTPENLLKASRYILETFEQGVNIGKDCVISNCTLIPPLLIGDRCTFIDSIIGPNVTVGNGSKLTGVRTNNTIIMEKATLSNIRPTISNSIIGSHVNIDNLNVSNDLKILLGDYSSLTINSNK